MKKDKTKDITDGVKTNSDVNIMKIQSLMEESGIDINLDVKVIEFLGGIKDIKEDLLKLENMTLYYTIKNLIGEILEKGGFQLLDAKYLQAVTKLFETASKTLETVQNITSKTVELKTEIKDEIITEEDIIRKNRDRQVENYNSIQ